MDNTNNDNVDFLDGQIRDYYPGSGWVILSSDDYSTIGADPYMLPNDGPLKIIHANHKLSQGNCRNLDYLFTPQGIKIFENGVREIKYHSDGYYLIEDGCRERITDYDYLTGKSPFERRRSHHNVVFENGRILSQTWYDGISPAIGNYFLVIHKGKFNAIDYSGNLICKEYFDYLTNYDGLYSCQDGCIYRVDPNGKKLAKKLEAFNQEGIHRPDDDYGPRIITIKDANSDKETLITTDGYRVFSKWYDSFKFSYIRGRFLVKDNGKWKILNILEEQTVDALFDELIPECSRKNYILFAKDGQCGLIDSANNIVAEDYDSAMWHDMYDIENLLYIMTGGKRYVLLGHESPNIAYIHDLLSANEEAVILGKNDTWYYFDGHHTPAPLMKFKPDISQASPCIY